MPNYSAAGTGVGTAIGSIWGPVGGMVGGALGGAVGSMINYGSGPQPPPDLQQPVSPGGVIGDYGGVMRDPYSGLVTYTNNDIGSSGNQDMMRNAYLQDLLMGGTGAGATSDLDSQIQFQQMLIDRLSNPQSSGSANMDLGKYVGKEWVGADGKLIDINNPGQLQAQNAPVYQEYLRQSGGKGYGSGGFAQWLHDAYNRNIKPKMADFENAQKAVSGNEVVGGEALKAAQLKLQQLQGARQNFTGAQAGLTNNPMLQFLNKEKDPSYQSDINRWRGQADADYAKMQQDPTLPFHTGDNYTVAGFDAAGNATGPNAYDFNASNNSTKYAGPDSGDYTNLDLNAAGQLQDVYARQAAETFRNANIGRDQNMANRGLLSSSVNEVGRAGDVSRLADAQANARLKGITAYNDTVGQNNTTSARRFQDQFNSAMARAQANQWGANFNANHQNQQYGRASDMANTGYSRQNNEFNLKNALTQQWRGNALQSLGVQGGLTDRSQAYDQNNFNNRMGFSNFLTGQSNNAFNQSMAQKGLNMQQTGQGLGVNQSMAQQQTSANIANQQMQNSFNNGQQQQANSNAQGNQQLWGSLIGNAASGAMGMGNNSWGGQNPTPNDVNAVGNIYSAYGNSQMPSSSPSTGYNPSTMGAAPVSGFGYGIQPGWSPFNPNP